MFDPEDVELALLALREGMTQRDAGELVGASRSTVKRWARGRVPHVRPPHGRIGARPRREEVPLDDSERAAYEAAMTENQLPGAVSGDPRGEGSRPASMPDARKTALGERLRAATGLPLREAAAFLRISRSSHECHGARLGRDRDAAPGPAVRGAFAACGERGYRAVWAELRLSGLRVSEKRVRRVMAEEGLVCRRLRRARRRPGYSGEASPAPPDLPLRPDGTHDFSAPAPSLLWASDITEFGLPSGGKACLPPAVDPLDGRPVAWSVGPRPTAELANSSLEAACRTLSPGERPVVHTDRGGHYRWPGWRAACERHGLVRSMSRKGRSPDNARMEGFFGTLKAERWDPREWGGRSLGELIAAVDGWMEWCRSGRRSQALGWRTPDEHRRALGYPV